MAYWLDGPLAYGLTGSVDSARLKDIARRIDQSMSIEPKVMPGSVGAADAGGRKAAGPQSTDQM